MKEKSFLYMPTDLAWPNLLPQPQEIPHARLTEKKVSKPK